MFTDIVGFTQLTDEHGDDLALALLERQEELVRDALPGTRADREGARRRLLLWFDDPCDAIDTCLRLQREFEALNEAADAAQRRTARIRA